MESWVAWCSAGLLLTTSPCAADDSSSAASVVPLACTFESNSGELEIEDACAVMDGATPVLAPHVVARMAYTKGLNSFAVQGDGWYYRRADGTTRRMYIFDNGPDAFVEGLARAIVDGKIAYVDRRLRIRIRTRFDWGDRFDHGRAEVCLDCHSVRLDNGEHSVMVGGQWGMIDKSGRELGQVTPTQAGLAARGDGAS